MFCPLCHAEYREGFTRCADCEVGLVERLEQAPPAGGAPVELAVLWSGHNPVRYTAIVSALEGAGIAVHHAPSRDYLANYSTGFRANVEAPVLHRVLFPGYVVPGYEIRVRQSDYDEALALVQQFTEADLLEEVSSSEESSQPPPPEPSARLLEAQPATCTRSVWTGSDESLKRVLEDCFRENAIPFQERPASAGYFELLVPPEGERHAAEIVSQVSGAVPPD